MPRQEQVKALLFLYAVKVSFYPLKSNISFPSDYLSKHTFQLLGDHQNVNRTLSNTNTAAVHWT